MSPAIRTGIDRMMEHVEQRHVGDRVPRGVRERPVSAKASTEERLVGVSGSVVRFIGLLLAGGRREPWGQDPCQLAEQLLSRLLLKLRPELLQRQGRCGSRLSRRSAGGGDVRGQGEPPCSCVLAEKLRSACCRHQCASCSSEVTDTVISGDEPIQRSAGWAVRLVEFDLPAVFVE